MRQPKHLAPAFHVPWFFEVLRDLYVRSHVQPVTWVDCFAVRSISLALLFNCVATLLSPRRLFQQQLESLTKQNEQLVKYGPSESNQVFPFICTAKSEKCGISKRPKLQVTQKKPEFYSKQGYFFFATIEYNQGSKANPAKSSSESTPNLRGEPCAYLRAENRTFQIKRRGAFPPIFPANVFVLVLHEGKNVEMCLKHWFVMCNVCDTNNHYGL